MTTFDVINHVVSLAEDVRDGKDGANALSALGELRLLAKALTDAEGIVEPLAREQAENMPKEFIHDGVKWTKRPGSRKLTFDHIPQYRQVKEDAAAEMEAIAVKARWAFDQVGKRVDLKIIDGKVLNEATGELVEPAKATYTKDSLAMGK